MKRRNRILTALLALLIALSVSACGSPGTPSSSQQESSKESSESSKEESSEAGEPENTGEIKKMRYVSPGNEFPDQKNAIAYINQQMQADGLNIELELMRFPWDVWDQKCNMMFASGEEFDLLHVMQDKKTAQALRSMNAIQPLNDYMDQFPMLRDDYADGYASFTVNGEILAISGGSGGEQKKIGTDYGRIFVREDMLPEDTTDMPTTPDEVIELGLEIQAKLQEKTGQKCYTWTHDLSRPMTWLHRFWADADDPIIVDNTTNVAVMKMDGTIESYYESDYFKKDAEIYRRMYKEGLVHPDILTLDGEYKSNEGTYGRYVFGFETFDYQGESSQVQTIGESINDFWLNPDMGHVLYFSSYNANAVPASCKDPTVPLSFINWAFENQENYFTFMYGEEGVHYTIDDGGYINQIKSPDDRNLYKFDSWQFGNGRYATRTAIMTDKEWALRQDPVEGKIIRAPAVGFNFDPSACANELANLNNEIITSIYPIKFGVVDYESNIGPALERLKAAGLDKVLEEYAKQYKAHYEDVKDVAIVYPNQDEMNAKVKAQFEK